MTCDEARVASYTQTLWYDTVHHGVREVRYLFSGEMRDTVVLQDVEVKQRTYNADPANVYLTREETKRQ